ncbi:MAG: DegT/DnrJ/EryC1/StrS family aminotransferase [Gammaproteobacteria bacterium]|nr:DegT/DnrJ/EryC1/StrS family aminotransferase [Gammaproteobacteria bacterium]
MTEQSFIPVNEPVLNGNEGRYLQECIDTGWISSEGPFVTRLEQDMARLTNRRHGIAVANGTAALDVAVAALGIGPGDEVILPTFTIISCASAVVRAGATPVLVDCDPHTWNMTAASVAARVTDRTRAIMVVHIYGLPVDMQPLLALAEQHGLQVIEDAAETIGQTCRGDPCGGFGDISTFSFYPNKHVTTGEGGMVLANDQALAERCRSLRNLCFQPGKRFLHEELGWNYRLSNLQAAVGVAQIEQLEQHVQRKRQIGARYHELLRAVPGLQLPVAATPYADNVYWVYGVVLDERTGMDAVAAMKALAEKGIGTRPFFWPMHEQPVFHDRGLFLEEHFPVAERLARQGFYLPSGLALTDAQIDRAANTLRELLS